MSGEPVRFIPYGVTLASGRGRMLCDTASWGGLIYTDNVGESRWEIFKTGGSNTRITGLRFRGSYSTLEGRSLSDSFAIPVAPEMAIGISVAPCEIDNCEFWGFGSRPIDVYGGTNNYVHHNYFHNGSHVYPGYGFCVSSNGKVILEANFWDYHRTPIAGGGYGSTGSKYEVRYCIISERTDGPLDRHGTGVHPQSAAADYIHNNTIRFHGYAPTGVNGFDLRGYAVDSVFIFGNWCWNNDSADTWHYYTYNGQDTNKVRIYDNSYGTNPPAGVQGKIPVANILASIDSGGVPLTVTFKATGSYDPDGSIRAFYWNFGDSCRLSNYQRYSDINDSVQYTFEEIGVYHTELMVTDDAGISASEYIDIEVSPNCDSSYLSCWIKDRYHDRYHGYFKKQMLIDNVVVWERDIAGDCGWEHVIVNVSDQTAGKDSVSVAFRLYCTRDSSAFGYGTAEMFIDDVAMTGANIANGNFEAGYWAGTWNRTDGDWFSVKSESQAGSYYGWECHADAHSGVRCYSISQRYVLPIYAGDWIEVRQMVSLNGTGILPSNEGTKICSLYSPYPNPGYMTIFLPYQLAQQSMVSLNMYDASGRFVRNLVSGMQTPGEYSVVWDGKDMNGKAVSAGVYFLRIDVNEYEETKQLVWLR
jgi:PKD repeat protein